MASVPNENILKLRKLTQKLNLESSSDDDEYKGIVKQLKEIVDLGKYEIESHSTSQSKIKCYESMCSSIATILNKVNLV